MEAYAAIIERQGGEFVLDTVSLEDPRDGEVLVKIAAAGMCHTDLTVRDQHFPTPLPAVLGHEGAGVVERVGLDYVSASPFRVPIARLAAAQSALAAT
ncbi:alcohol dehydrogenase catalytic domain-containing protein [Croceicoccus naphthovorans]|uniref:Aryl-alcohol dehydrogenase n=2 Tax=Sphingomonadales TaxID=204457 RepID=A0A0G3XLH0_9SPHN|nr:alcohol dehydrogenase catalytic domain-containing protein [Croceicoccus naphthovorans]AIT82667.1 aryl-alcohol dehydrogenase [Novosphingobium pentaromativorans US6-1]EZP70077.1 Aryl alcohol dehydrogenase [Sphingomonas paucimobilis]AKM12037.1 aryl-alcohol dehydrogenase [Croceicoccus naphthovorans]EHJ58052.1 aryl alcohol dehydrogenase [Novosphingobium pentaromativorans US6-1]MBB3992091.1 aryl-alcohol dehydrogenase [Croceicoccus naphthovorans]